MEAVLEVQRKSDGLYWISLQKTEQKEKEKILLTAKIKRKARDWHLALNHPSTKRIELLIKKNMATGIVISDQINNNCDCSACFMGKSK
jgi:hypothetical protein